MRGSGRRFRSGLPRHSTFAAILNIWPGRLRPYWLAASATLGRKSLRAAARSRDGGSLAALVDGLTVRWRRSAGLSGGITRIAGLSSRPPGLDRQTAQAPLMRFFPLQHTLAMLRCPEVPLAGRSRYGVVRPCGVTLAIMQSGSQPIPAG